MRAIVCTSLPFDMTSVSKRCLFSMVILELAIPIKQQGRKRLTVVQYAGGWRVTRDIDRGVWEEDSKSPHRHVYRRSKVLLNAIISECHRTGGEGWSGYQHHQAN